MNFLEQFILGIPHLFLKKIPYAWLGAVFFWKWPPVLSGVLLAIVLIGLLMMAWQERAWRAKTIREFHSGREQPYLDRPNAPLAFQLRNLVLLFLISGLLAWLFGGKFDLSRGQWFALLVGFMLLYMDTRLLGASITYLVTDQGIGIRLATGVDYRLFFKYEEIQLAAPIQIPREIPVTWEVVIPVKSMKEGVLLTAANPGGFSKRMGTELLLAPSDIEKFLGYLSSHIPIGPANVPVKRAEAQS